MTRAVSLYIGTLTTRPLAPTSLTNYNLQFYNTDSFYGYQETSMKEKDLRLWTDWA